MRIAVDAMGGDFAPRTIVEGSIRAVKARPDIDTLYLVGNQDAIQAEIDRCGGNPGRIEIRHASEVIDMGESPAVAIRRKKDASISRAVDLVKNGEADAVFAAGSTGAAVAASTLKMRTLEGVRRPGIAVAMPTTAGKPVLLIDGGATTDCTPEILLHFAIMGSAYSKLILGRENPTVGLMSVGTEEAKGNALSKETFELLEGTPLNFIGNVEGHDIFTGKVDVIVCDGFTGNVILKTSESLAHAMSPWIKQEVMRNPVRILGALLLRGAFKSIKKRTSNKTYGGAPLLGVNGICIIGHGNSDAEAAQNGILHACNAVQANLNREIVEMMRKMEGAEE